MLIVQPTESGKSSIPLTTSIIDSGIMIIIENTLALGSKQCFKINYLVSLYDIKNIQSYHLDILLGMV